MGHLPCLLESICPGFGLGEPVCIPRISDTDGNTECVVTNDWFLDYPPPVSTSPLANLRGSQLRAFRSYTIVYYYHEFKELFEPIVWEKTKQNKTTKQKQKQTNKKQKTKQKQNKNKTKQNKTKQNKTKQNKTHIFLRNRFLSNAR